MTINKYLISVYTILLFSGVVYAQSESRVYFSTPSHDFPPGAKIAIDVLVDTDVPINAVSFEIGYTTRVLQFISSSDSESIIDIWRDFPPGEGQEILRLEGGMTGQFSGERGRIIQLIFLAKEEGVAQISFRKALILAADGKGTKMAPQSSQINIRVLSGVAYNPGPELENLQKDFTPPRILDLKVVRNPADGVLLLIFRAQDQETGIKEVSLQSRNWVLWGDKEVVSSPLEIQKGAWSLRLTAADNSGNKTNKTVIVWPEAIKKLALIILAIFIFKRTGLKVGRELLEIKKLPIRKFL